MAESFYDYYQAELSFIFQQAREFAREHKREAMQLDLEENRSRDPHVERLIEAFALLSGRIRRKLDDEFPELTDAMLGVLYPHYLAPVPSMALVQFQLDPTRGELPDGFEIPRHSELLTNPVKLERKGELVPQPDEGVRCTFRTTYPVTLLPVRVAQASWLTPPFPADLRPPADTAAALRLVLEATTALPLSQLALASLRFYLSGNRDVVATLYDMLFNHLLKVTYGPGHGRPHVELAPEEALAQVGFDKDQGLLPYPSQSFVGYRLLTELFAFPAKFSFLDLKGLDRAREAGVGQTLEAVFYADRAPSNLDRGIDASTFRLGCTPIVNLFEKTTEPIPITHLRSEYRIVPDVHAPFGVEVYRVNSVRGISTSGRVEYRPFYGLEHGGTADDCRTFWLTTRRASLASDRRTNVFLTLVDLDFGPAETDKTTAVVRATCTNGELPGLLKDVQFTLTTPAPLAGIHCLQMPTPPLSPPTRKGARWRLVSHLCLNHLSLADPEEGLPALQAILRLYDFTDPEIDRTQSGGAQLLIEGITAMSSRRVVGWSGGPGDGGFCRGVEVTLELDETKYYGTGAFLFASVLERFLGLYASINSFTRLKARTKQGAEIKTWPPRAGDQPLI